MKRTPVTDAITYLEPASMSNFQACAGLIVTSGGRKILIDTNLGPGATADLIHAERPDAAIISHYHLDHATWGATLLNHSDATLYLPAAEARYLTDLDFFLQMTAGPSGLIAPWRDFSINHTGYREIDRFETFQAGENFTAGRVRVACVGTPGHSPGHSAFYFPEDKILFTGDMGVDRFGPWYGWQDCDLKELLASILRLRGLNVNLLLTSHGGIIFRDINTAWDLALARVARREASIRERLDRGMDKTAIVAEGIFFPNKGAVREPMRSFLFMWDDMMFDHHQALLEEGGLGRFFPMLRTD
jgi:glyoxylase-like metal-dependent hydrolase (beta-lactamase superfamily II)